MNNIDFSKYDKITDTMIYLGSYMSLNFTVKLSKQNNNTRYPMHKEYLLNNNYINSGSLITIKRNFDYYMELTYKTNKQVYFNYKIGPENILYVLDQLNKASAWFRNNKLFCVVDNKLTIVGNVKHIKIPFYDTVILDLQPIVYNNPYNGMQEARLRFNFDDINYADISIDKLMGMIYLISNINLYQSAQILINYLKPPEYGHNLVDLTRSDIDDIPVDCEEGVEVRGGTGRRIEAGKSVFDRINDL